MVTKSVEPTPEQLDKIKTLFNNKSLCYILEGNTLFMLDENRGITGKRVSVDAVKADFHTYNNAANVEKVLRHLGIIAPSAS